MDAEVISFFVTCTGKKIKKMTKIIKTEVKIRIF